MNFFLNKFSNPVLHDFSSFSDRVRVLLSYRHVTVSVVSFGKQATIDLILEEVVEDLSVMSMVSKCVGHYWHVPVSWHSLKFGNQVTR